MKREEKKFNDTNNKLKINDEKNQKKIKKKSKKKKIKKKNKKKKQKKKSKKPKIKKIKVKKHGKIQKLGQGTPKLRYKNVELANGGLKVQSQNLRKEQQAWTGSPTELASSERY